LPESERYDPPRPTGADRAHQVVKAALSAAPYVGGPAAELFAALIGPPLVRRQQAWMERIAAALQRLHDQGRIDLVNLAENDEFITILLKSSQVALREHRMDKVRMLRAAVMHTAEGVSIHTDQQLTFVRYIDELTAMHLGLLVWVARDEMSLGELKSFQELYDAALVSGRFEVGPDEFYYCFSDLERRGLLRLSEELAGFSDVYGVQTIITTNIREGPMLRVTDLGAAFLDYVSAADSLQVDSMETGT